MKFFFLNHTEKWPTLGDIKEYVYALENVYI